MFSGNKPLAWRAALLYVGFLGGLFLLFLPDLRNKVRAEKQDRFVALATDWADAIAFSDGRPPADFLAHLKSIGVQTIVMPAACRVEDEGLARAQGLHVLWRLDDSLEPRDWLDRFKNGDGVFVAGDHVLEHPLLQRHLPGLIRSNQGFLCLMEFVPDKLLPLFASRCANRLIKSHWLGTREMLVPKTSLWNRRLLRAVDSRWARLLVVRMSPALSLDQNVEFQAGVVRDLEAAGFSVGAPRVFSGWPASAFSSPAAARLRMLGVLFVSTLTPAVILCMALALSKRSIGLAFVSAGVLSLFSGAVIHALGSTPAAVMGLQALRGVKFQLIFPLLVSGVFLFSFDEVKLFFNQDLKVRHVAAAGSLLCVAAGLYLMRSGNFPLIPVTDSERLLRDGLDRLLVARPRFKEFLIGHPLFLVGLSAMRRQVKRPLDGRFFLWIGLVGQISIMNTFTHFHSPFGLSVIRTLHGLWIGAAIGTGLLLVERRAR